MSAATSKVLHVFFKSGTGNQVVIQVSKHKWEVAEEPIHESLESLSSIHESEWHELILKQSERSQDGSLGDVRWIHQDLVVALYQVNDREVPAPLQF